MEKFEQLEKLGKLKDQGLLSEVEFEAEKKKILESVIPRTQDQFDSVNNKGSVNSFLSVKKKKGIVLGIIGGGVFVLIGIIYIGNFSEHAQKAQALAVVQEIQRNAQEKQLISERIKQQAHNGAVEYLDKNVLAIQSYLQHNATSATQKKYPNYKHIATESYSFEKDNESYYPILKGTYIVRLDDEGWFSTTHYRIVAHTSCQILFDENSSHPDFQPDYRTEVD